MPSSLACRRLYYFLFQLVDNSSIPSLSYPVSSIAAICALIITICEISIFAEGLSQPIRDFIKSPQQTQSLTAHEAISGFAGLTPILLKAGKTPQVPSRLQRRSISLHGEAKKCCEEKDESGREILTREGYERS